jgi:hypothetical protein
MHIQIVHSMITAVETPNPTCACLYCIMIYIVTRLITGVVWKTIYREVLESSVKDILGSVSGWIVFNYSLFNYAASSVD